MEKDVECEPSLVSSPGKKRKRQREQKIVQDENNTVEINCSEEDFIGEDTLTKHAVDTVTEMCILNSDLSQPQQKEKRKRSNSQQDIGAADRISQGNAVTSVIEKCMYSSTTNSCKNAEKGEANSQREMKSRNKIKKSKEIPENSGKIHEYSAGETNVNDWAREDVTCVEPSKLVRVTGLESSTMMINSMSNFPASTSLKIRKGWKVKKRNKENDVESVGLLGAQETTLQFPIQCLSLEPEAPAFCTGKVACKGKSKEKEHGRMLKEVVKNNVQNGCIIESSLVENVEMKSVLGAAVFGSTNGETSLSQKGKGMKKRRHDNTGTDSAVSELSGEENISLQFPADCLSLEPDASVSYSSKFLFKGSKKNEHVMMLNKELKNEMQDGCIMQRLVGPEDENMVMGPIWEAGQLETTSGKTSIYQKRKRNKDKRDNIIETDSVGLEHSGEDGRSLQVLAQYSSLENEAPISCITKSDPVLKTEKEECGTMINQALKVYLQGDCQNHNSLSPELNTMEIKSVSKAAGLVSTIGEIILSQKRERKKRRKIVGSDNTIAEPPGERITSEDPSDCLSLEHSTTISCVGVSISEKKNVKNEQLMEDKGVVERNLYSDSEFQSDVLQKAWINETKSGSKVVGLGSTRHIESAPTNSEDICSFSKIECTTCSKEKTLLCHHSVVHKNSTRVQIGCKRKEPCSSKVEKEDRHLLIAQKDTTSHLCLEKPISIHLKKKLLVLDINGLLADIVSCPDERCEPDIKISGKAVFMRPFCKEFLQFCFERFYVGVWSSRMMKNVQAAISYLMGKLSVKLLFCWDQSHCTRTRFKTVENSDKPLLLKELKKLWEKLERGLPWEKGEYDKSNTLLVDDSPYKALRNPMNSAIFPYPYKYTDTNDTSLGHSGVIRRYLEGLALANNVQEYVASNPFGQPAISESNPSWSLYQHIVEELV